MNGIFRLKDLIFHLLKKQTAYLKEMIILIYVKEKSPKKNFIIIRIIINLKYSLQFLEILILFILIKVK